MEAVFSILAILLVVATGFVLGKRGFIDEAGSVLISKLTVNVALPCYMFVNLVQLFDRQALVEILPLLTVPYASMFLAYGLGYLCARLFRVPEGRRGTFTAMFSLSNMIFIGLPVNVVFFGTDAIPFVLLSYIANTTVFWTVGVAGIRHDGILLARSRMASAGTDDRLGATASPVGARGNEIVAALRRLVSPPLMGLILGIVCIAAGIPVPPVVDDAAALLGNMTTPLSMLFIGYVLSKMPWRSLRFDIATLALLLGRFAASPAIAVLCVAAAGSSGLMSVPVLAAVVLPLQAAMPAMTQTAIVAKVYNADHEYAAIMTSFSTVVSIASLPLTVIVLRM